MVGVATATELRDTQGPEDLINQLAKKWQCDIPTKKVERLWAVSSVGLLALGCVGCYYGLRLGNGNIFDSGPVPRIFWRAEYHDVPKGFYREVDSARVPWYNPHQNAPVGDIPNHNHGLMVSTDGYELREVATGDNMGYGASLLVEQVPVSQSELSELERQGKVSSWFKNNNNFSLNLLTGISCELFLRQHKFWSLRDSFSGSGHTSKESNVFLAAGFVNLAASIFAGWKWYSLRRQRIKKEAFYITEARNMLKARPQLDESKLTSAAKELLILAKKV